MAKDKSRQFCGGPIGETKIVYLDEATGISDEILSSLEIPGETKRFNIDKKDCGCFTITENGKADFVPCKKHEKEGSK